MTTDETTSAVRGDLYPAGWEFVGTSTEDDGPAGFCEFCSPDKPGCIVCLPSSAEDEPRLLLIAWERYARELSAAGIIAYPTRLGGRTVGHLDSSAV